MTVAVTRRFTFSAGHHLPYHDGKCKRPHGHNYGLEVTVQGEIQQGGPKSGMVFDFGDLDRIVREEVVDILDHQDLNDLLGRGFEARAVVLGTAQGDIVPDAAGRPNEWYWDRYSRIVGMDGSVVQSFREITDCPDSTAEVIARWAFTRLSARLRAERKSRKIRVDLDLMLTSVRLSETEDSWVTVY